MINPHAATKMPVFYHWTSKTPFRGWWVTTRTESARLRTTGSVVKVYPISTSYMVPGRNKLRFELDSSHGDFIPWIDLFFRGQVHKFLICGSRLGLSWILPSITPGIVLETSIIVRWPWRSSVVVSPIVVPKKENTDASTNSLEFWC